MDGCTVPPEEIHNEKTDREEEVQYNSIKEDTEREKYIGGNTKERIPGQRDERETGDEEGDQDQGLGVRYCEEVEPVEEVRKQRQRR